MGLDAKSVARRAQRRVLRFFGVIEPYAAWAMLIASIFVFFGVLVGLITVGEFRWPTLLLSGDLMVSGFSAVQQSEDD